MLHPSDLTDLVTRARTGDLEAYGRLVSATRTMVSAVARRVLRDPGLAEDAAQEALILAYRRLADLDEPAAFIPWLRRIAITVALNMRRRHRVTLLRLDDVPEVPVLDEAESHWTDRQRLQLAQALLTLTLWSGRRVAHKGSSVNFRGGGAATGF